MGFRLTLEGSRWLVQLLLEAGQGPPASEQAEGEALLPGSGARQAQGEGCQQSRPWESAWWYTCR
jgi:hypothetical protein